MASKDVAPRPPFSQTENWVQSESRVRRLILSLLDQGYIPIGEVTLTTIGGLGLVLVQQFRYDRRDLPQHQIMLVLARDSHQSTKSLFNWSLLKVDLKTGQETVLADHVKGNEAWSHHDVYVCVVTQAEGRTCLNVATGEQASAVTLATGSLATPFSRNQNVLMDGSPTRISFSGDNVLMIKEITDQLGYYVGDKNAHSVPLPTLEAVLNAQVHNFLLSYQAESQGDVTIHIHQRAEPNANEETADKETVSTRLVAAPIENPQQSALEWVTIDGDKVLVIAYSPEKQHDKRMSIMAERPMTWVKYRVYLLIYDLPSLLAAEDKPTAEGDFSQSSLLVKPEQVLEGVTNTSTDRVKIVSNGFIMISEQGTINYYHYSEGKLQVQMLKSRDSLPIELVAVEESEDWLTVIFSKGKHHQTESIVVSKQNRDLFTYRDLQYQPQRAGMADIYPDHVAQSDVPIFDALFGCLLLAGLGSRVRTSRRRHRKSI